MNCSKAHYAATHNSISAWRCQTLFLHGSEAEKGFHSHGVCAIIRAVKLFIGGNFMKLEELYQSKCTSAEKLAEAVGDGWVFGMDAGPTQTEAIMAAICERAKTVP